MVKIKMGIGSVSIPIGLLLGWWILSQVFGTFTVPSPHETFAMLIEGLTEGWIQKNTGITLTELLFGFLIAAGIGIPVGIFLGLSDFWREAYESTILITYSIPKVTLYPIFLFLFAFGTTSKIAFGAFHGVFPILILTMNSTKAIRPIFLKVGRSFNLNFFQTFKEIIFPQILPSIVVGLRLGFCLTFLGVILGEMFASYRGLGFLLMAKEAGFHLSAILAVILVIFAIAFVINVVFILLEKKLGIKEERIRF